MVGRVVFERNVEACRRIFVNFKSEYATWAEVLEPKIAVMGFSISTYYKSMETWTKMKVCIQEFIFDSESYAILQAQAAHCHPCR